MKKLTTILTIFIMMVFTACNNASSSETEQVINKDKVKAKLKVIRDVATPINQNTYIVRYIDRMYKEGDTLVSLNQILRVEYMEYSYYYKYVDVPEEIENISTNPDSVTTLEAYQSVDYDTLYLRFKRIE